MAVSIISLIATGILVVCGLLSTSTWSVEDGNRTSDERTPSSVISNSIPDSLLPSSPKRNSHVFRKPYPPYYMPYHFYPYMPLHYDYQQVPYRHKSHQQSSSNVKKKQTPGNNRRYDYEGRTFEPDGWHHGGQQMERTSDFYYILPILLVIGLGSFLIPIISTFFTAMITSGGIGGCCAKRSTREESAGKTKDGRDVNPILSDKINSFWDSLEKSFTKFSNRNTLSTDSIDLKIET